jgi:uncharacterized protein YndB with AHSA1/START domain
MRYIIPLFLILAVALSGFLGFGSHLSKNYVVTEDAVYERPVEMVWQVMTDYASMPSWSKQIKSTKKLSNSAGKTVWNVEFVDGHYMHLRIDESVPLHLYKASIVESDLPYVGVLTMEMTQINEKKTAVKMTEEGGMRGVFSRLFMHYAQEQGDVIRATLKETGEELARRPLPKAAVAPAAAPVPSSAAQQAVKSQNNAATSQVPPITPSEKKAVQQ